MGMAGGLGLGAWRNRSRNRVDREGLADLGLMRLDAQGNVRELGRTAAALFGLEQRCDRVHLEDLPLQGLEEWFQELDVERIAGRPLAIAERELSLESYQWSDVGLEAGRQQLCCRLQPMKPHRSLLPAWMSFSVVFQEPGDRDEDPCVLLALPENTAEETMKSGNHKGMLEGMKILVAEDFKSNQLLLHFFLEKEGAEITLAGNGQFALEQARSGKYDLVFLDDDLPGLDSVSASRTLRKEGFEGPIVVLTPHLDPTAIESYRLAGCTDHLEKPFKSRELRNMAENIAKQTAAAEVKTSESDPRLADPEFMELINEFVASLDERLHDLEAALESQDWRKIESVSHRLAGTAGIYHMPDLSALSAEIEDLVRAQPGSRTLTRKISELKTAIHGVSGHQLIEDPRES